jgi:SHS2 domain-containing protein
MEDSPGKYNYLEHTADAKFQAFGSNLEEAFENSAIAMISIMCDPAKVTANKEKEIDIEGKDLESLLYNFLEEILFILDSDNQIAGSIKTIKIKKLKERYSLKSVLLCDSASKYQFFGEVKAITYNSMFVKKQGKKFIVQVVVDL